MSYPYITSFWTTHPETIDFAPPRAAVTTATDAELAEVYGDDEPRALLLAAIDYVESAWQTGTNETRNCGKGLIGPVGHEVTHLTFITERGAVEWDRYLDNFLSNNFGLWEKAGFEGIGTEAD